MSKPQYVIGVDVGTGSARAGIFDAEGHCHASASEPIEMWKPKAGHAEQSSDDIWRAVCEVVRECRAQAKIAPRDVVGIAFDATCSMVVLDGKGAPLPVNDENQKTRNVIMWMDQRAVGEAEEINAGGHDVLTYVGGSLSPEMQTPKLMWLKRNLPDTWKNAGKFFDLADFLTWRSTGEEKRSLCTTVCKWTYLGHLGKSGQWDKKYFQQIGLDDVLDDDKIGNEALPLGQLVGNLSNKAARELALNVQCAVATGAIDAHAGGLGLLGAVWQGKESRDMADLESALALISGTSDCHLAVSRAPKYIPGIWGPYFGAMVPGMWLTEAGQTTAGSALDTIIESHANYPALVADAKKRKATVYELLNEEVARLQELAKCGPALTRDLHVLPYFSGNRSPHSDPRARAAFDGVALDGSLSSQALLYYATLQSLAYGTREIIEKLNDGDYSINTIYFAGGGAKNALLLQETADITRCEIVLPETNDAVLLGSAILASTAAGLYEDVETAMQAMSRAGNTISPRTETTTYHNAKYKIFKDLYTQQKRRRTTMKPFGMR